MFPTAPPIDMPDPRGAKRSSWWRWWLAARREPAKPTQPGCDRATRKPRRVDALIREFYDRAKDVLPGESAATARLTQDLTDLAGRAAALSTQAGTAQRTSVDATTRGEQLVDATALAIVESARLTTAANACRDSVVEAGAQADMAAARLRSALAAVAAHGDMASALDTIVAQAKVVAMNATIEAVRAGEAGRGFVVVASHIGGLAAEAMQLGARFGLLAASLRVEAAMSERPVAAMTQALQSAGAQAAGTALLAIEIESAARRVASVATGLDRSCGEAARQSQAVAAATALAEQSARDLEQRSATLGSGLRRLSASLDHFLRSVAWT